MSRAKILVIEDNATDIELLRLALDRQGEEYDLEVLQDGEQALQFVHEHRTGVRQPEPCAILLDLHLPKHGGMEILRAVKLEPALAHIQVIMISSLASPREESDIQTLGAVYRSKPVTLHEFLALGAEILALCKQAVPA